MTLSHICNRICNKFRYYTHTSQFICIQKTIDSTFHSKKHVCAIDKKAMYCQTYFRAPRVSVVSSCLRFIVLADEFHLKLKQKIPHAKCSWLRDYM